MTTTASSDMVGNNILCLIYIFGSAGTVPAYQEYTICTIPENKD